MSIKELIKEMTLEEKVGLCSGQSIWDLKGVERLGIPSIRVSDGPHGLRKQGKKADHLGVHRSIPATCFPSAVGLASTWNRSLIEKVGMALGEECQSEDVSIILGPGINLKRSPLCGRNFEYFSEDPYLSAEMAASYITGVQSQGIGTSLKHLAVNNQEHRRLSINAKVDERTLRELYLASFENVVKKAQPWTVMSAYNQINGEYASENKKILTEILREEWGFEGFVVSDWGAVNERVKGLEAGLDLEMPTSHGLGDQKILEAIQTGELSEETLDKTVERLLTVILKVVENNKENASYDQDAHHQLGREVACEGMVLLKNEEQILPLKKEGEIAVIGELAKTQRFQGGGSSNVNPSKLDNILEELEKKTPNASLYYAKGYSLDKDLADTDLIREAKKIASQSNVAVLFVGLPDRYESESYDREHLRIPDNHRTLIESVAEVQPNLVVVLCNGAPVEMPWLDNVKGLLEAYLGGQAVGGAVCDLLFGDVNPSGKLAETFPMDLRHNPSYLNFPGEGDEVEYKEGLFVGYRYYDTKGITPLFPFGYGLSYTAFEYSDLTISKEEMRDNETVEVNVTVKNTGNRVGKEVVQLYVRDVKSTVIRPEKELKGFQKIKLNPGEEKKVSFLLDKRSFAYYNVDIQDWYVETGDFELLIGKSSKEIVLKKSLLVVSTMTVKKKIHRNTLVGDIISEPLYESLLQAVFDKAMDGSALANLDPDSDIFKALIKFLPLRALVAFNSKVFTEEMLDNLIQQMNEVLKEEPDIKIVG